jgi:four helix bundle suffix protein
LWEKDDPRALQIRQLAKQKNRTYETYESYLPTNNPELFCNTMISLIHQTNFLLDRQIKSLETSFIEKGGIRERMYQARKSYRTQQTEEVLFLLRDVYRELAKQNNKELMQKIEKAANILKERG